MEWAAEGALLSVRPHGESAAIIEVFTADHGRHAGVVRGGASRRNAPHLQPGAQLALTWRARLEDHLGAFTFEPLKSRSAAIMTDRIALAGLNAICALTRFALPEREAYPNLYQQTVTVLDLLGDSPLWSYAYLRWEQALLEQLGFGLDLSCCAVTGDTTGLHYVSPRSGRAVTEAGAGAYRDRLLPLPQTLLGHPPDDPSQVLDGLLTTGYFLRTRLAEAQGQADLPEARQRLVKALSRSVQTEV